MIIQHIQHIQRKILLKWSLIRKKIEATLIQI